ncbi:HIT-like domain-containing protein [Poronia punctata]|nr:HIT-like domain-containing protein [Poronia punctata]
MSMARPIAPSNLPTLVKEAFVRAQASGDLSYYPTQVTILPVGSLAFQLRFAPSLAEKPKPPKPVEARAKPFNPFENPSPALLVAQLPPSHRLVLNKFAIVPEHFILVTKGFKPQTHLLEADDVDAAYACVQAYQRASQQLYVFFNSGDASGASQPHRHLQLLPVERMKDGLENIEPGADWTVLADNVCGREESVPFTVFTSRINADMSAEERHRIYVSLYKRAVGATLTGVEGVERGESQISYNLAMTSNTMALCPRTAEGAPVRANDGNEIGTLSLNGTLLAGTALVKTKAEWDALRTSSEILPEVLRRIGVSPRRVFRNPGTD